MRSSDWKAWPKQGINFWHNRRKGETCYILGNGPSLKKYDLEIVRMHGYTFGTNRIYLDFVPDYYVAVNRFVVSQWHEDIENLGLQTHAFIPIRYKKDYPDVCYKLNWIKSGRGMKAGFAKNLNSGMWEGHTVTYVCLQLAYWMGFSTVYLLGVDHDYGEIDGKPNEVKVMSEVDKTHYRDDYFPVGCTWALPNLEKSTIAYSYAKKAYEDDGRRIFNAGDSKLDMFDRYDPPSAFLLEVEDV